MPPESRAYRSPVPHPTVPDHDITVLSDVFWSIAYRDNCDPNGGALYRAVGVNPTFTSPTDIAVSKRGGGQIWTTHPASSHW
jgi:hypothetical protein